METVKTRPLDSASARDSGDWLEKLARVGYASRGVIYLIIAWLALLSALGSTSESTDAQGAIGKLLEAPGGWLLVLAVALGLIGYSVWRFCQAVFDADRHGNDGKALLIRTGLFVSAVTHLLLALWAGKVALGLAFSSSSGSSSNESLVATLMSQPFGHWLVGILGAIFIGVGIAHFMKGYDEKFEKYFKWDPSERRKMIYFCKFGLYARGVIFAIIGGLTIRAAWTTDPSEAGGLKDAMQWLSSQPFGPWLFFITAIGIGCFGVYSLIEAWYRRVEMN